MSSTFDRQREAFNSGLKAAAAAGSRTAAVKRPAPASPSPSVASTTSLAAVGTPSKKQKRDPVGIVFSQPERSSAGNTVETNMVFMVEYIKKEKKPMSLQKILEYNNLNHHPEAHHKELSDRLRSHPRVIWHPDPALEEQRWETGTYEHRPLIPGVKDKVSLLRYMQTRESALQVQVKELKDGWPDCEEAITQLEREHKLLVTRWQKDGTAKALWLDDPSVAHDVDREMVDLWNRAPNANMEIVLQDLFKQDGKGMVDPRIKANAPVEKKAKKRTTRRPLKSTNTHMEHLLKDYSHLKR